MIFSFISREESLLVKIPDFRIVLVCFILILIGQNILSQSNIQISVKAIPNRDFSLPTKSDYFLAKFTDCTYKVKANGLVTKYFSNTSDSIKFSLDLLKGSVIERAEFTHFGNFLIICYTETDGLDGDSYVAKFDLQSLNKIWVYGHLDVNLSRLIIRNNFIYITSSGNVAKLDLSNGSEAIRLRNLYDPGKHAFNKFDDIIFNGDTVIFLSKNGVSNRVDKVKVNDRTNKLITIDK
jgi:hypothetical protein